LPQSVPASSYVVPAKAGTHNPRLPSYENRPNTAFLLLVSEAVRSR